MKQIKEGHFYKVKESLNGNATPGGYFYIGKATPDNITFSVVPFPSLEYVETVGRFTVARADLEKLIDTEVEL